jgi:serine/threonine protein phosphatase PrpC
MPMVRASAVSHPGVRPVNDDHYLCQEELSLFVVAHGMGGDEAGGVARLAVESIENFVRQSRDGEEYSWPYGIDTRLTLHGNRLRTAIGLANRRLVRESDGHGDDEGMGTTVVSALIAGSRLVVGHVGDSRLYLLSDGVLTPVTQDDSWAATVLAEQPSGASVGRHLLRNVLTNALGVREHADIHVSEHDLKPGTTLLLCTDGLHSIVDDERLLALMAERESAGDVAQALVDEALAQGAHDNVTALVVSYDGEG